MMVKNGDFALHSGELVNQNIGTWFKYQRQEARCFKEAHWLRDESLTRYTTTKANMLTKKEKLFKGKDVSKWEIKEEKLRQAQDIIDDKDEAFKMMMPSETKKVEYLAEESSYFTNQCWKESRRVIMSDYAQAREHFVDMGEQMHRHIYEINLSWGQMLDFYSDLNNARKEKDDSYAELNHIGEEVIEPDEQEAQAKYDGTKLDEQNQPAAAQWEEGNEEDAGNLLRKMSDGIDLTDSDEDDALMIGEKIGVKKVATIVHD